jgi:hypothetical protein
VIIHTLPEIPHIGLTGRCLSPAGVGIALVEAVVHRLNGSGGRLLGFNRSAGSTSEKAADSVADGGTDCYTAIYGDEVLVRVSGKGI